MTRTSSASTLRSRVQHPIRLCTCRDGVCCGPTPADAITAYGGRKWTLPDGSGAGCTNEATGAISKHRSAFGMAKAKLLKKKSVAGLHALKEAAAYARRSITGSEVPPEVTALSSGRTASSSKSWSKLRKQSTMSSGLFSSFRLKRNSDAGLRAEASFDVIAADLAGLGDPTTSLKQTKEDKIKASITHSTHMSFIEFCELFRSFMIR